MTVRKYFRQGEAIPYDHTWPAGQGIPGWVLQYGMPYGTSDAANDPVMQHDLPINAGVRSVICTPILDSMGEVLGYFDIRNKRDGPRLHLIDQEMLMALSPAASIAIQNALAYEQRVQTETELSYSYERLRALAAKLEEVREEERTGIARELHDQLGQALTALKFDLARLTDRLVEKDATLAQEAKAITTQMDTMVKTVRRIATDLRPGVLDNLGLAASIEWQAREFQKRMGIACTRRRNRTAIAAQQRPIHRALPHLPGDADQYRPPCRGAACGCQLDGNERGLILQVDDDGRGIERAEVSGTPFARPAGHARACRAAGGRLRYPCRAGQRDDRHRIHSIHAARMSRFGQAEKWQC